jgi:hypothetical protein
MMDDNENYGVNPLMHELPAFKAENEKKAAELKIKRPYRKRKLRPYKPPQRGKGGVDESFDDNTKIVSTKHPNAPAELAGLTSGNCPIACGPACIISGDICIHPHKGGLQAPHRMRPDVMRRYEQAVKMLKHMAVDKS